MSKKRWAVATVMMVCAHALPAGAQGIPVYDNSVWIIGGQQLAEQAANRALMEANLAGKRKYGELLNGNVDKDTRRYAPQSMNELLNAMNADLPSSTSEVRSIYGKLNQEYSPLTASQLTPGNPTHPTAVAYERQVNTTFAAMAASETAYNNAEVRTQNFERIMDELNNTEDLKSSVDLQTRAIIESGLVNAEQVRLNALQIQLEASQSNEQLAARKRNYEINQYSPE